MTPETKRALEGSARRAATPRSAPNDKTRNTIAAVSNKAGMPAGPRRPLANKPNVRPSIASEALDHGERALRMAAESAALLRRLPKTKDSRGQPR